jgi:endonuclease/exonuclease/phosphatase family metal-dependent hydrolase
MTSRSWIQALGLLLMVFTLGACGETENSSAPPPSNPFEAARVGADSTLEVMTWNIENFPKYTAALDNYVIDSPTTVDWVREIIEGLQPDIVAVQEIYNENGGGAAFDKVVAQLEGWGGVRARSDNYANLGFLYREDGGLVFTTAYEIFVSSEYSREFPRSPYVLEATWNGTPVVVIANHLKASGDGNLDTSDLWDEETRRRDACVLLEEYVAANHAGQRVFIVGDMNDELDDDADDNVFLNFLDAPASWRFTDLPIALGPSSGWSYPGWPSHLDHILVTDALFPALAGPTDTTMVVPLHQYMGGWSNYDSKVSDHLPVVIRLQP